jgi:hypothetical protein
MSSLDEEAGPPRRDHRPSGRQTRRLSDKILVAFHHACDQGDFEVAEYLLQVLEMMLKRRPRLVLDKRRRRDHDLDTLVAAHERLWQLRHPDWQQS